MGEPSPLVIRSEARYICVPSATSSGESRTASAVSSADMTETPETLRIRPERFVVGGESITRDSEGRIVFVRGGVPGDHVEAELVQETRDWYRVDVREVLEPSPIRVEPPCPRRVEGCGGCDWQHVSVPAQLPAKVDMVRDVLGRIAKLPDAKVVAGGAVSDRDYRTSLRVIGDASGRPSFRAERSHDTVPAAGCLVAHPSLVRLFESVELSPGLEVSVRTSVATGETTARWDRRRGDVKGLPPDVGTGPHAHLHEEVRGFSLRISAPSFFQSGPEAATMLVDAVVRAAPELADAETVVDAYAGVGLFAVAAAPSARHVITIESAKSSVADCKANLSGRTATVHKSRVERWGPNGGEADVVIADPSRAGLRRSGVQALTAASPLILMLVSCDPASLARDTVLLAEQGYRHGGTEVIDAFPHTHHIECVTRFERR